MHRPGILDFLEHAARIIWVALASLLTVGQVEPHLGVVLAIILHTILLIAVLPPAREFAKATEDQRIAYRLGKWTIIRTSWRRVILWAIMALLLTVVGNLVGYDVASFFSIAFIIAISVHAGETVSRADSLISEPVNFVRDILTRKRDKLAG